MPGPHSCHLCPRQHPLRRLRRLGAHAVLGRAVAGHLGGWHPAKKEGNRPVAGGCGAECWVLRLS